VDVSDRGGGDKSGSTKDAEAVIWPDILLIVCFSVVIAFSLSSIILWSYLTFRDSKRLQREEGQRKVMSSKAGASRSQTSLRTIPVKKVSSKSSKEVQVQVDKSSKEVEKPQSGQ
jgi:hypothetical protein